MKALIQFDTGEPISVEITTRIEDSGEVFTASLVGSEMRDPIFDRAGECEMLAQGATVAEALAALDVLASRPPEVLDPT